MTCVGTGMQFVAYVDVGGQLRVSVAPTSSNIASQRSTISPTLARHLHTHNQPGFYANKILDKLRRCYIMCLCQHGVGQLRKQTMKLYDTETKPTALDVISYADRNGLEITKESLAHWYPYLSERECSELMSAVDYELGYD